MRLTITILPGDGIGPEVIRHARRVLQTVADASRKDVRIYEHVIGAAAIRQFGTPLPDDTREACERSDAVLLGAVGDPSFDRVPPGQRPEAGLLQLRRVLGGFANLRPAKCEPELISATPYRPDKVRGADMLIVRELLGGLYFGEPRAKTESEAFNTMRYTKQEVERVARVAFEQARERRRLVTSVDKANVLETSQLWRSTVVEIARDYPEVTLEHMYVDACAMRLAVDPTHFDVILTENLFGDILSDQAASVAGSIGMLPSATIGGAVDLYEPVHGSAPDIAGQDRANPLGAIASVAMLLRYTADMPLEANLIEQSIRQVLESGLRPADLAGSGTRVATTTEIGEAVEHALGDLIDHSRSYHGV